MCVFVVYMYMYVAYLCAYMCMMYVCISMCGLCICTCVGVGVHVYGTQRLTQDVFLITYHLIFVVFFFFPLLVFGF